MGTVAPTTSFCQGRLVLQKDSSVLLYLRTPKQGLPILRNSEPVNNGAVWIVMDVVGMSVIQTTSPAAAALETTG